MKEYEYTERERAGRKRHTSLKALGLLRSHSEDEKRHVRKRTVSFSGAPLPLGAREKLPWEWMMDEDEEDDEQAERQIQVTFATSAKGKEEESDSATEDQYSKFPQAEFDLTGADSESSERTPRQDSLVKTKRVEVLETPQTSSEPSFDDPVGMKPKKARNKRAKSLAIAKRNRASYDAKEKDKVTFDDFVPEDVLEAELQEIVDSVDQTELQELHAMFPTVVLVVLASLLEQLQYPGLVSEYLMDRGWHNVLYPEGLFDYDESKVWTYRGMAPPGSFRRRPPKQPKKGWRRTIKGFF